MEYNVLIVTAEAQEKSAGGVYIPETVQERDELAYQIGRIVRASPLAFNYYAIDGGDMNDAPKVGDLVWFARYAGGQINGADGRAYRLVKDKDIGAVFET